MIFGQAAVRGSEAVGPSRRLWREQASRQELRTVVPTKSACSVSRTTGTVGNVFLNTFAASRPFMCGMARSMSTKSGLSSFACLIASTPLEASPHTRNLVRASMAARMASSLALYVIDNQNRFDPCNVFWLRGRALSGL
jgi:hypothetical protein